MKKRSSQKADKTNQLKNDKTEVLKRLKQAVNEVILIKRGKLRGIPAKELLNKI